MGVLSGANRIIFAGRDLADFGVYVNGSGTFGAPERDAKNISVNNRNGDIIIDNGRFKNQKVKYKAFIIEDFDRNMAALRDFLYGFTGYQRLEDTYHPDEFRRARVSGAMTVKPVEKLYAGEFELVFDCAPQRFLKSGEEILHYRLPVDAVSSDWPLMNEGDQNALPLVHLIPEIDTPMAFRTYDANGSSWIDLGSISMQHLPEVYIDTELQEVYSVSMVSQSYNLLNGKFPYFGPGLNELIFYFNQHAEAGHYVDVEITPRWWRL
jgi:phage-related protein